MAWLTPLSAEFAETKRNPWIGHVLLGALLVLLCAAAAIYWWLDDEQRELTAEIDQLSQKVEEQKKAQTTKPIDPKAEAQRKQQQEVSDALNYPWSAVFGPIEQAASIDGVALLTMAHDQTSGVTQLGIEAIDVPSALRYVDKLNEASGDPSFWTLTGYQLQQRANPQTIKGQIQGRRLSKNGRYN
jgi:hypothetical protein